MRAPFFGGGRGDWGEQDETVAVLEGGLEVEVQYRAFSLNIRLPFPHDLRTGRRRGGPTLENTGEAGGQAIPSVRRAGDGRRPRSAPRSVGSHPGGTEQCL